jgi:hypothetical protein
MEKDKATPPRQKLAELLYDLFQGAPVPARINGEGGKTAFWSRDAQIAYAAQIIAEECTAQKLELRKALRDALDLIWKHHEIGFIRRAYEQGTGSCELCKDDQLSRFSKILEDQAQIPRYHSRRMARIRENANYALRMPSMRIERLLDCSSCLSWRKST